MGDRETVRNAEGSSGAPARRLDLRGLRCPLPVLKITKALKALAPGEHLVAIADDPLAEVDVPNLARETGDAIIETRREEAAIVFCIRRGADSAT